MLLLMILALDSLDCIIFYYRDRVRLWDFVYSMFIALFFICVLLLELGLGLEKGLLLLLFVYMLLSIMLFLLLLLFNVYWLVVIWLMKLALLLLILLLLVIDLGLRLSTVRSSKPLPFSIALPLLSSPKLLLILLGDITSYIFWMGVTIFDDRIFW